MRLRSVFPARRIWLIYLAVLALGAALFTPSRLSTDLLGIFPENAATRQLRDASQLPGLNPLLLLSKGFDAASRERAAALAKALENVEGVARVVYRSDRGDPALTAALQRSYAARMRYAPQALDDAALKEKLAALYRRMSGAFVFVPLNTSDPLGLFEDPLKTQPLSSRGGLLSLGDAGYLVMATVTVPVSDAQASQKLYDAVHAVTQSYGEEVLAFAPHFFTAENSAKIKGEVNLIVTATLVLLLLFYAVALRHLAVLPVTATVLAGSLFFGLAVTTAIFEEVSVFTLAFGSGIVMMAVDYFFHYYCHGYYGPQGGERRKVLAAFGTTAAGFAMLSFASFPLIEQLSIFAVAALAFAWFQFTFLFGGLSMQPRPNRLKMPAPSTGYLKPAVVALGSLLLLGAALTQLRFDGELRRLDYRNDGLLELQRHFSGVSQQRRPLLLYGESPDALIERAEELSAHYASLRSAAELYRSREAFASFKALLREVDFADLRERIGRIGREAGFREGLFGDAYRFAEAAHYIAPDPELMTRMGYETRRIGERWVGVAYLDAEDAAAFVDTPDAVLLDGGRLLGRSVEGVTGQLMLIGALTLAVIVAFMIYLLRRDALRALNYILFPVAAVLAVLALGTPMSLMHLFALIIVIVAGIDYGIYMSRPERETDEAILYAMLTTFAGFGIFVFSHIGALHHIGTVIATGIAATFILQRLQLRRD